ncbi:DNA repair exonuclease SbcCD nuclease subunit [Stella humosa]|uniref:DNA repair exonuclease SbcCD nuclease subunit n=1 Tax=Stella humosa TaxID=94 RepID=A0A3N1KPA5_9PROT|nr:DNA repair exonuclease [Stella humosa]ROP83563.1 DNA repair exonuclease SbcCD nuclease subunit [Stella humosa]BBK33165.1 metallophosphoesterase [Stella humosa]
MTSFRFLHAADIHLDSPLHGLSRYDGLPVEDIRSATRAAFDNLIQYAIDERVNFVVIAGDLFDGEWRDMGTGLYFARAMGRLDQAGIPAFVLAGNHDAASTISRTVPWPPNVRQFGSRRPETHRLPELAVAVHGQSFATPAVTDNLVVAYPPAEAHAFNIGVLHTALAGRPGHATYAPCSVEDLRSRGYDYWALGHVHEFEIVGREPHIVFPGNVQGRTIRETGPKGAVLVTVVDGEIAAVARADLDVIRWMRLEVDCAGATLEEIADRVRAELGRAHGANGTGRPLVARVSLVGAMAEAGALHDRAPLLRDNVRAIAASISPDLHVEKVKVLVTQPVAEHPAALGGDIAGLIDEGASDPELIGAIKADLERFMVAADATLGPCEDGNLGEDGGPLEDGELHDDGGLRLLASQGDWPAILRTASLALRSRLTREA